MHTVSLAESVPGKLKQKTVGPLFFSVCVFLFTSSMASNKKVVGRGERKIKLLAARISFSHIHKCIPSGTDI